MLERITGPSEVASNSVYIPPNVVTTTPGERQGEITVPGSAGPEATTTTDGMSTAVEASEARAVAAPTVEPVETRHRAPSDEPASGPGQSAEHNFLHPEADESESAEPPRADSVEPPTEIPPADRLETGGQEPEPTLNPGQVIRYQDGELREGADENYYRPEAPDTAYTEADTFVAGRVGPENPDLTLEAGSEGCRIVTLYNRMNTEGTVVHIDVADVDDVEDRLLVAALQAMPSLATPYTEAHVIGDEEESNDPETYISWNTRLANRLNQHGITDVWVVSDGNGKQSSLHVADGHLIVRDNTGDVVYDSENRRYTAPDEHE